MKNIKTRSLAIISIMSGLAFILYYLELPVGILFPSTPFLKIDFSDVPAVLTGVALGPVAGIIVEAIKNVLHLIFITKEPAASGEIGNFVAGVLFILPIIYGAKTKDNKKLIISMIFGSILMTLAMCFVNYFITLPLYGIPANARIPMIISSFLPFNLLKGVILSIVIYVLLPYMRRTLDRFQ